MPDLQEPAGALGPPAVREWERVGPSEPGRGEEVVGLERALEEQFHVVPEAPNWSQHRSSQAPISMGTK